MLRSVLGPATALLVASALGTACGPRSNAAGPLGPRPASSATAEGAPIPPERYPPPIPAPRTVACTLEADVWPLENTEEGIGIHYLRFAAGGPAFAKLYAGFDVELVVPAALPTAGAHLRIDVGGLLLAAQIEAAELPLYAASPLVLGGVFIPNHEARLLWRSARAGAITVTADAGPRVRPRGSRLETELPCAKISVHDVIFEAEAIDELMKAPRNRYADDSRLSTLWLRPGRIPLASAPGGDEIVDIDVVDPPDDTVLVHPLRLLGREKAWSRVALEVFGGVLFGWVPNDALVHSTKQYVDLSHDTGSHILKAAGKGPFVACDDDVPLFAEAGGERRRVGQLRARTPFVPLGARAEWTVVDFPRSAIAPVDGAWLLLETARLASCTAPGRQKPGGSPLKVGSPKVDALLRNGSSRWDYLTSK